jgi:alkylation response protein AidB-like acyl-CoA dehydrogenase
VSEHAAREAARFLAWMREARERRQEREDSGEHERLMEAVEEVGREMAARLREEGRFGPLDPGPAGPDDGTGYSRTLARLREYRQEKEA